MARKKTWREKRDETKDLPRVQPIDGNMKRLLGEGTIVLPSAQQVDRIMRSVPSGKLITINQIREILARQHGTTTACPIVTGIHARICAGAAGEELEEGRRRVTPYWRTPKSKGELNEKYPGGSPVQAERLEAEGHRVVARGKRAVVEEFERRLVKPD